MNLTEHFTLEEMEHSDTALRLGITNHAPAEAVRRLQHLAEHVLEPLRQWWGHPICIKSGYRSKALNRAVGGATSSQHMRGEAVDIQSSPTLSLTALLALYDYIRLHLPYDQLILERASPQSTMYWIHVSCLLDLSKNRHQEIRGLVKHLENDRASPRK